MDIVQSCVPDLVEFALIPYSGWNWEVAREPLGKPTVAVKWSVELRNITGMCAAIYTRVCMYCMPSYHRVC